MLISRDQVMAKNLTRSKSVMSRFRGRDATSSSASLHVTDDAQAKAIDTSTLQKFELGREERRKLLERPSTSGGTKKSTGNFPKMANSVKRETRDDLFFNPLRAHGKDGPNFYSFPLPSTRRPPSPVVPQVVEPLLQPSSPDSIMKSETVRHNVSEAEIGMALGSPAHPPENWQQASEQSHIDVETINTSHPIDDVSHYPDSVVTPKQKKGRKWFGLFGTKKEKTPTTFYQVKPESQQDIPTSDPSSPETKRPGRSRGRSNSSRTGKKPDMKRAQTAPTTHGLQHSFQASTSTSIQAGTPDIRVQGSVGVEVVRSYPNVSPQGPKLDLAIPSVEMERYSVMFGEILPKAPTAKSSLLQRRQATLDQLKSVEDELATKEAELEARTKALSKLGVPSSQIPHNSPSFSLFPSTPSRQGNPESSPTREKSLLRRSNTLPAGRSPARPSFAPGLPNDQHADNVFDNETPTNRDVPKHGDSLSSTSTKKPRQQSARSPSSSPRASPQIQTARTWSPEKSQLLSPSSAEESEADTRSTNGQSKQEFYIASSLTSFKSKIEENEPTWQMINSKKQIHGAPSSISGSTTSETSTVSSSHSTASFSSVPSGIITNAIPMPEREKVRGGGSRKTSPTGSQLPQKEKETRIPVKKTLGPRPIISAFNTTTRSSESTPHPMLKSPVSENHGLKPKTSFSSRPSMQNPSSDASLVSANSPRPSLQKPPMISTNFSSPRKFPLPSSPLPQRSLTITISPHLEPSHNAHQKQESTSSITPSLLDVQIDDHLDIPNSRFHHLEQKRLEPAAGVSIARQISVSRQQRQLLVPIKTSGTVSKRNGRDLSPGLKSPLTYNPVLTKKIVMGDDVMGKKGSPVESVSGFSSHGAVLSSGEGQIGNGSDGIGMGMGLGLGVSMGGKQEVMARQASKPVTPVLVLVPGVDGWGAGGGESTSPGGLNSSKERVEAMMRGNRGSPVVEQSGWGERGDKREFLSVNGNLSPRTEIGSGHQYRRSERPVIVDG